MAKFRYYIVGVINGVVKGSNEHDVASDLCGSEDYFVIDSEEGVWLAEDMMELEITEQEKYEDKSEADEADDDDSEVDEAGDGVNGVAEREG